jgi:hypothetical protein
MAKPQQVLILEPSNELTFKGKNKNIYYYLNYQNWKLLILSFIGPFTEYVNTNLTLSNPSPRDVYFKFKVI